MCCCNPAAEAGLRIHAGSPTYNTTFFCDLNGTTSYRGSGSSCYLYYGSNGIGGTNRVWAAARSQCRTLSGGDLVVHESYSENSMVEAYFQNSGRLGVGSGRIYYYWMGVTRQNDSTLLTSKAAAGKRYSTVHGTRLPFYAPSNGPLEGPAFAPYAHWAAAMFGANR
jgi:hypothetical protein